jgi:hypothetical protein
MNFSEYLYGLTKMKRNRLFFSHWAEFGPRPWAQSVAACPTFASQKAEARPGPRLERPARSPGRHAGRAGHLDRSARGGATAISGSVDEVSRGRR